MFKDLAERRTASWILFGSTATLLVFVLIYFGGPATQLPNVAPGANSLTNAVPLDVAETIFQPMTEPLEGLTRSNPFHTAYFIPEPTTVPEITSKSVAVQYQGFYRTAEGILRAFVMVEGKQTAMGLGDTLLGDYGISSVGSKTLALTNAAGDRVTLEFRKPATVELPVK